MKKNFGLLVLLTMTSILQVAYALEVSPKMGKPTNEELSMTTYDPDPEAEAVVLYSERYTAFKVRANKLVLVNNFKKRIKVLKEDGKKNGDIEILIYHEEDGTGQDRLNGLKAATYNLENGNVVKTKLSSELESDQRVDQYFKVHKFSMPNVKVGSVIELEYSIISEDISNIDPWYAQEKIPVFYTVFEVIIPDWYTFSTSKTGPHLITYSKTSDMFSELVGTGQLTTGAIAEKYIGRELPRIVEDEHVFCINDYCDKVVKDITHYVIPGYVYQTFNQDWSHELGGLMSSSYFGRLCKKNNPFEKEVKAIQWPEDFSVVQKIDSLRNLLWSRYSWDENYSLYARDVRNLNKEKLGTSSTLNFALMNMLNDAGIAAYPVVMNNRLRGMLPSRPSRKYLKAMVLAVYNPTDSAYVYVDAGSKDYPVGVIPSQFLVRKAFLLKPEVKEFSTMDLREVCKGSTNTTLHAQINAEGLMTAQVVAAHRSLDAVAFRQRYKKETDEADFIQKMSATWDAEISDYEVLSVNTTQESVIEQFNVQKQQDSDGERLYVNPFIGVNLDSPFKAETRDLPVEFAYSKILKYAIKIQLPEGYAVEELPANLNMKMPDGKLVARINFSATENRVNVIVNINRSTLIYRAEDYELLRSIYTAIEQTANGKIILKKA